LGRDVAGVAKAVDLAKMPHLLIAGATGSGKSVMVNAVITSLLCRATPDDVRMILMDLKRVELASYNGLPHLLVPVVTEPERAKAALKWAVNEMEGRYRRFAGAAARNIKAYNETRADPEDRLPYIVIIIDELADPHYDMSIIETDEDSSGSVDDLADEEADRLLPDAVAVIREYDRASASLLQRRLKVGYARAARIIDQLEQRGYIGAFDGSNA